MVEKSVEGIWDPVYGDRRNEIVFIGQTLNQPEIMKSLEECLISDEEFKLGDLKWEEMFKDPFTEWQKALKNHPLKNNFKQRDGDWEDDDDVESEVEEQK